MKKWDPFEAPECEIQAKSQVFPIKAPILWSQPAYKSGMMGSCDDDADDDGADDDNDDDDDDVADDGSVRERSRPVVGASRAPSPTYLKI